MQLKEQNYFFRPKTDDAWNFVNWNVIPAIGIMTFGN